MMETLFLSNWQHEKNGERLTNPARLDNWNGGDEVRMRRGGMEEERMEDRRARSGQPRYKRRRIRGGAEGMVGKRSGVEMDL
jgi:DNA excision repair protein ERCC-4